ncbi:EF-hand domain-containing protein [Lysobacter enzymogenes]|uniref:EF-hand domain-containing protein n=1 Tax=Lysobacter enzymogenes TaxID=69 RepID=UPI001A95A0AD|nr:EF-hand domain-containing protein [Lysobacter enzymogenes]QQP95954.1 EF-hand domain-containing protein [Lysobacter enzymogenes]
MNTTIRTPAPRRRAALALALIAAAALPAAFVQAQPPPHPADTGAAMQRTEPPVNDTRGDARTPAPPPGDAIGPARFSDIDANGDQKISREEAAMDARLAASFSVHDLDRDGFISPAEFQAGQNKSVDER